MNVIASNPLLQSAQAEAMGKPAKPVKGRPNPAFQPETKVDLEGSVKTTLEALNKTLTSQNDAAKALPKQIQQILSNIMKNSFSLDESVAKGLGSALRGQRASTEQLNVLAKILNRLNSSTGGKNVILSQGVKNMFANVGLVDGNGGKLLEPTVLHKSFMQLMEGKSLEEMPKELQYLLQSSRNAASGQMEAPSKGLKILKQLMRQLMPSNVIPQTKSGAAKGETAAANMNDAELETGAKLSGEDGKGNNVPKDGARANGAAKNSPNTQNMASVKDAPAAQENVKSQENANNRSAANAKTGGENMNAAEGKIKGGGQNGAAREAGGRIPTTNVAEALKNALNNVKGNKQAIKSAADLFSAISNNLSMAASKSKDHNTAFLKALLSTKPFQNTPELLQSVRSFAREILTGNKDMFDKMETRSLNNLSMTAQHILTEKDATALRELIRIVQQNLPYAVKSVAVKQNMPEAVKLWTVVQLGELADMQSMSEHDLAKASRGVNDFVSMLKTAVSTDAQAQGVEKSMVMMMPLYLGENEMIYPSYIHIFHQQNENAKGEIEKKETWFRVCMLTENVGAVELVFRMYGRRMDMKLAFSDEEAAIYFPYYMQNIRESFRELNIQLADVKIKVIGDTDEI
jgi:hypothetical protein